VAVLATAAGLAIRVLGDDGPAPEDAGEVTVVSPGSGPRAPREPMTLAPSPDLPSSAEPTREPNAALLGTIAGRVTTSDRRVIREGRVEAMRGAFAGMPGLIELTSLQVGADIGTDGRFALIGLPAVDDLVLRVDGETFALTDVGNFVVRAGQSTDLGDVVVSAGMDVIGRVVDERGHTIDGASVGLFIGARTGLPPGDDERPRRLVLTNADGRFRIPHSPISSFSLSVAADGYANARGHGGVLPGERPASVSVLVTMRKELPLRGRVVALPDGAPVEGALLRAVPLGPGLGGGRAQSDADGRFEITGIAYGNYNVEAILPGYSVGRDRTWTKRDDYEVEIGLQKQGSLKGFVVGEGGKPVASFDLQPQYHRRRLSPEVPSGAFRRIVNRDGAFELLDLEPGFTCVQVWAKGYALTQSECIKVARGQDIEGVVVTLVRGATLDGLVLDDRGSPVPGARISLHYNKESDIPMLRGSSGRPAMMKDTRTGPDGRFSLRDLTAMTYQVEVDHRDFAIVRRNNVVVEAASVHSTEDFLLDRAARVEGVATTTNGQLQADSIVYLQRVGGTSRQTSTDGRGRFVFPRLTPGDYMLSCFGKSMSLASVLTNAQNQLQPFRVEAGQTLKRNVISAN